jgi:hypothetical protein
MNLPKGIGDFLNDGLEHQEFTDKVLRTISEYYVIYKSYYDFDEAKFSLIAIDCAKNAKNENTFPSYFRYTLESELGINIQEKEIILEEIPPSQEFLLNEKFIRKAFRLAVMDYQLTADESDELEDDLRIVTDEKMLEEYKWAKEKIGEGDVCNECISQAILLAGYPDKYHDIWSWLQPIPINAPRDYEEVKAKAESSLLPSFTGSSYHSHLYMGLLSSVDHNSEEKWVLHLKNWKYGVKMIYKQTVDRYVENIDRVDVDEAIKLHNKYGQKAKEN